MPLTVGVMPSGHNHQTLRGPFWGVPGPDGLWTLDEANAALWTVEARLRAARAHLGHLREAKAQMEDLLLVWGPAVHDPQHEAHAEFRRYAGAFESARGLVNTALADLQGLGIEVKDVEAGLVDFRARMGDEVVYLCWRMGEPAVAHWHTLEGGFAGRRPVPGIRLD